MIRYASAMPFCHRRLTVLVSAAATALVATVGLAPTTAQAAAPTPQWASQFGTAGASLTPVGVASFPNGSSVVGFAASGTAIIGGTTVTGATAVTKLSTTGSIDWVAQTSGSGANGEAIAAATGGGTIIAGHLNGSTTLASSTLTSAGSIDILVAKLDANGAWLWATSAGGTGGDRAYATRTLSDGSVLVAGQFQGTATFGSLAPLVSSGGTDIFVAKLSADGTWLSATRAGGAGNEGATDLSAASDGTSVITGVYSGTTGGSTAPVFGTTTLSSLGSDDIFVAKLSADGAWLWAQSAGSTALDGYAGGRAVTTASDGSVLLTGAFAGPMTLGALPQLNLNGSAHDIFVAKLDAGGAWVWASSIGGTATDKGTSIAAGDNGSAIVVASYGNTSLTVGSTTLTRAGGNSGLNLAVARISSSGSWDWATSIASSGTMPIADGGLAVLPNGSILMGGSFSTAAPAQTITLGSTVLTSVGGNADLNAFVTCLGDTSGDCQGIASAPDAPSAVTASTPADGTTSTSVSFTAANANGSAILAYDASCTSNTGGALAAGTGTSSPITVANLTAGATYTCTVTATNGIGTSNASSASAAITVPSPAAPSGSSAPAATTATAAPASRATLVLNKVSPTAVGVRVTFRASGRGKATVVGTLTPRGGSAQPNACRGAVLAKRAGTVTIACDMSKAKRRAASGGTLTLVTTFTPVGGAVLSATRTVTLAKVR